MKNAFVVTLLLGYALSCRSNNIERAVIEDSLAANTVQKFYQWYIHEAYPKSTSYYQIPSYRKLDETTYVFDLEEYEERLNTVPYFSDTYRQTLISRLRNCNREMREVAWDYEPEPMFNIKACNYLWGNQWVGGQGEVIGGFKVDSIEVDGSKAKSVVSILTGGRVFVRSIVSLEKIKGNYKISGIELSWQKE